MGLDLGGPWTIKNSAETSWGEQGYMRLQHGNHDLPLGRCGLNGFVYFPVKEKPSYQIHKDKVWWLPKFSSRCCQTFGCLHPHLEHLRHLHLQQVQGMRGHS
ncbi:hypothetical protein SELMODRAFT_409163 [Selaginella moellendorffii]|uniref:Peptidase C1A papain C-terminal domain-containing protein n=1 Tax=Selaginella moellendorffii TaxID=88036 RepID=D8RAK1_SELML|nr:hypothetical protein SELMODRAFT_409163 [Selaginella moellendorffii]